MAASKNDIAILGGEGRQFLCPGCRRPSGSHANFCQYCGRPLLLHHEGPDRYHLTAVIKDGGMGAVYKAVDARGKVYAVKELLDRFRHEAERAEGISRFADEADLLTRLSHRHVPRVYNSFTDRFTDKLTGQERQHYYLVMDFVDGEDLEQLLEREGAQHELLVLHWADQLCDVLAHMHEMDLIYRDMKPSNVMIDRLNGGIKLVDFGIAKVVEPTQRGTLIGTPGYSPPEQYQGLTTPASDIYALGATLHHVLTGRDPRNEVPFSFPPLRELRPELLPSTAAAVQKALAMRSEERWGSMSEFKAALRNEWPVVPLRLEPAAGLFARPAADPDVQGTVVAAPPRRGWGLLRLLRRLLLTAAVLSGSAYLYIEYGNVVQQYLPDIAALERYLPGAE